MRRKRGAGQPGQARRYEDRVSDEAQLMWTLCVAIGIAAAAILRFGAPGSALLDATRQTPEIARTIQNPVDAQISLEREPATQPLGSFGPK